MANIDANDYDSEEACYAEKGSQSMSLDEAIKPKGINE